MLAGGAGGRLELLTDAAGQARRPLRRRLPADRLPAEQLPALGTSPTSGCRCSTTRRRCRTTWPTAGPWDLDRTFGGLMMLPPFQGTERGGWVTGTANLLWRQAELIREFDAGRARRGQLRRGLQARLPRGRRVPPRLRRRGDDGDHRGRRGRRRRATGSCRSTARRSPTTPTSPTSRRPPPRPTRSSCSRPARRWTGSRRWRTRSGTTGWRTSAAISCPRRPATDWPAPIRWSGYWRDVGTIPAYWQAHRDFLAEEPPIDLDDPAWPRAHPRWPAQRRAPPAGRGGRRAA